MRVSEFVFTQIKTSFHLRPCEFVRIRVAWSPIPMALTSDSRI